MDAKKGIGAAILAIAVAVAGGSYALSLDFSTTTTTNTNIQGDTIINNPLGDLEDTIVDAVIDTGLDILCAEEPDLEICQEE